MSLMILTGVAESDSYPYGRQTCHITFQVEFKQKKGFRFVTQTTNPKTGRLNNPKKGTYSDFMVMIKDENDHVKPFSIEFRGYGDISKIIDFLTENEVSFTPEQSQHLWVCAITNIRANAGYTRLAEGKTVQDLLASTKVAAMIKKFGDKEDFNEIKNIGFNLADVKEVQANH